MPGFRIENIWAFLSVDRDDDEGLAGAMINGIMMPLVAGDEVRRDALRPYAEAVAKASGHVVEEVQFTRVVSG